MKKHPTALPPPATAKARRRRAQSPVSPSPDDELAGITPGHAWEPGGTDIERPSRFQGSIETVMRDESAGGMESPGPATEVRKATPFE